MARNRKSQASEQVLGVAELQKRLASEGAGWEAGETSLSALTQEEREAHLGLDIDEAELAAGKAAIAAANKLAGIRAEASLPAAVDWRNKGGNFVTPIRDQQSCGSCVAFATIATIESHVRIACKTPNAALDYSEAFLFYCGCGNCCATGWNFAPALEFCKTKGVAQESAFPYVPGNRPCPSGIAPSFKIQSYTSHLSLADRKAALAERGPVVGGLAIYQDFFSYRTGVYRHVSGSLSGYHAVEVIGYDDNQKCWICKNSWGPNWGDSGFFRIAYGEAQIDTSFAFWEPKVECPVPAPVRHDCTVYVEYLRRVITAARNNRQLRRCLLHYVCHRGVRPPCSPAHLSIIRTVLLILLRCPKYRAPFCRAL